MGKWEKVRGNVIGGSHDANIDYEDLCGLLTQLGFESRTRGSHTIFRRPNVAERPNLQRDGRHAKPYQVRQVRAIILKYGLGDDD